MSACAHRPAQLKSVASQPAAPTLAQQRRDFQTQELATPNSFGFIFSPGEAPRIIWRDAEAVKKLGGDSNLCVRWFDADLHEAKIPDHPGRWGAYIESRAPNGTPVRRAMTFYARPPTFLLYFTQLKPTTLPAMPGPIPLEVWREHESEIDAVATEGVFQKLNDSENGAIVIAGLSEMKPTSRPALNIETATVRNDDFHLAVKLKVLGLEKKVRPLRPPTTLPSPAPVLHDGTMRAAGMRDDAKARIDNLCRAWAEDSGEPFVTVIARHGVIVTHEAFGRDKATGKPIDKDYRGDVASITKTITALLFARFQDQGLLDLEEPIGDALPDWPRHDPHVPTFRQCFTHMSGLIGHGDFGGCRNPYLDNILLNGIDANEPGKTYNYAGANFDIAAKAMEMVTGRSIMHLYDEGLFKPLDIGDVPMANASAGAQPTSLQLAKLAQLLANHGRYGDKLLFSEQVFENLLPENLGKRYPGVTEIDGIGMHWMRQLRAGAKPESKDERDFILGPRVLGHGSLSQCMFLVDLNHDLIITQIRRGGGERFGEWSPRFFQTIADCMLK